MRRFAFLTLALALVCAQTAQSQEVAAESKPAADASENDWYYGPTGAQPEQKTLGRQKAELRAKQRLSRLSTMRWYGFSGSRPTAAALPFTTAYSPHWTRPGGRPFGWYISQRPVVVVSPYYPSYYR